MENEKLLEKHFEDGLDTVIHDSSDYPMLLMVLGEKHAALTMNASDEEIDAIQSFCDDFDFTMRVREGRTSKPEGSLGNRPVDDGKCVFVADDEKRFKILERSEGRFYGYSDSAVGEFLGFPESAIEFFDSTEQPGMESRKFIEELKQNGEIEDTKFIGLTSYIPAPAPEAVKQAVETGKKRYSVLQETEIGKKYVQRRFENSLY
jgi:hypothetical protein